MNGYLAVRGRQVAASDRRDAMTRLLEDGQCSGGMVVVSYHQQWATLFAAQRLGYLDQGQMLTDKGREYLAKKTKTAAF